MKVQIIDIHPRDAFYDNKKNLIGEFGILEMLGDETEAGFEGATIKFNDYLAAHYFYAVKFREVK